MKRSIFVIAIGIFILFQGNASTQINQPMTKSETRGVWMHPGLFGTDEKEAIKKIQSTLDEYVQAGINTLLMLVKNTTGEIYFKSKIGVPDPAWNWDFFDVFLKEAQKRKMTVHPWFCVFPEGKILGQVREHPEWLIISSKGEMVTSVNPALPQVREYEISLMKELVLQYPVDWVHLDYIRYPCFPDEPYFSYDPKTRALFKEYSGIELLDIKATDSGNMIWNEWISWNREQVTQFIRELRDALKTSGRTIKISAAVFPNADNAKVLIGQDWASWAEQELVDMLCPMLYTNHTVFFEKYVSQAVRIVKGHCQICPGIGIGTSHNQNTPEGMLEQLKISRNLGSDGVIFFSSGSLKSEFLTKLNASN